MKSLKSRLSNGVSTITFRHLVPNIQKAKDFGFGPQIPYHAPPLGSQGRGGESYILRKSSYFKFFEKQHVVTQKSNKNNTLAKYAIFGIWHIPTYFAVGQGQPRPNVRHFFWKGGRFIKIGSG